jgi:hypothetical protein
LRLLVGGFSRFGDLIEFAWKKEEGVQWDCVIWLSLFFLTLDFSYPEIKEWFMAVLHVVIWCWISVVAGCQRFVLVHSDPPKCWNKDFERIRRRLDECRVKIGHEQRSLESNFFQ